LRAYALALRQTLPKAAQPLAPRIITFDFSRRADVMPDKSKYVDYENMHRPIRALGCGAWKASFEALALAQYEVRQEFWIT
jgi:hypothetical protein